MDTIECRISRDELEELKKHEAVLLAVYTTKAGEKWSQYADSGTKEEMDAEAARVKCVLVLSHIESITSEVVLVADLIPPNESGVIA
jgi:hypothetical protein